MRPGEDDTLADPGAMPRPEPALRVSPAAEPPGAPGGAPETPGEWPARIGRFVVFAELGAGGMGQVYAAYDPELDRKVALKLVQHPPNGARTADWQARLVREAQAMAQLSHRNVVTVYEVGAHEGELFLAMELVEGKDLARWLAAEPRPWRAIVEVFCAAGEGLAAAHGAGLVHRDFKPSNVLVGDDGRVCVADFGLVHTRAARTLAQRGGDSQASGGQASGSRSSLSHTSDVFARDLTNFGALLGTPAYMAPEQITGEATDERSDVFAFCVALWEALHGQRPFGGDTMTDRLEAIRRGEVHEPSGSTAPRWLRPLLLKGLAREPGERWQSMRALLDALARDPEREQARRRRTALRAVAILALGGALVYGVSALWTRLREHAREAAAQADLDATLGRLASLQAEGRQVETDVIVDAFVTAPEHAGTRAQVRALRWRADQRRGAGDIDGALDAYSEAYAAALDPGEAGEVLLGLATLFGERREWGPLAWVLASLEGLGAEMHARTVPLRLDAALYRRDFVDAEIFGPSLGALAGALGQAQRSEHRAVRADIVDLEGDGGADLLLFDTYGSSDQPTLARTTGGLPRLTPGDWAAGLQIDRGVVAGGPGPAHFIGRANDGTGRLLAWRDGRVVSEASWPVAQAMDAASGDLDGDGVDEIYVGLGPYNRRLLGFRRDAAGWSAFTPSPTIDATDSDVMGLAIGDIDGDGRDELLVGLGPWEAYDLRVLRAGAPGQPFEQVARRKLGVVEDVVILPTPDGPLIAVAKNPETLYAAPRMFPQGDHTGVAPGLYLFRVRGEAIEEVAFAPVERTARLHQLLVADLDGDGRAEIVGDIARLSGAEHDLEIYRLDGATLSRLRIGGLIPLAAAALDADPADELLVADTQDDRRVWALGVGAQALPELDFGRPKLAALPPTALAEDPSLRRQWVHAGELAGLGLLGAAGRRYAELARALPPGDARGAAYGQAAELAASAGDLALAASRFEEAARSPGLARLLERAADNYERMGRFDDAIRVLGRSSEASAAVQGRISRHVDWRASEREESFARPLAPAWQLRDPLALRHDRIRGVLVADLMTPEPILALPVLVGDDILLRVELSLAEMGYGGSFALRLRPDRPGAAPLEISAYRSGSVDGAGAQLFFHLVPDDPVVSIPLPRPGDRVVIEFSHLSALGEQRLAITVNDVLAGEFRRSILTALSGPAQLELLRSDPLGGPARPDPWTRVELRRIVTRGLTIGAAPDDPWRAARRALVAGEGAEALVALAAEERAPAPPELPIWRTRALLDADDGPGAARVLAAALDLREPGSPAYGTVLRLLRARGEAFAPVLRAALGRGYLQLFHDAWAGALTNEQFGVPVMRASLEHGPDLANVDAADVPGLTRGLPEVIMLLRLARAEIYAHLHDVASAHRELDMIDTAVVTGSAEGRWILGRLLHRIAILDLGDGQTDHAIAHLTAARALSVPEVFADLMRADPELAPLHADPRWPGLLGE